MSTHTTSDLTWHKGEQVDDDLMRHPTDGEAWKEFDCLYLDFAQESWNVRLGLATYKFNLFGY